jgi:ferredoxin
MRISFQREKCIGCNYCMEAAPQRWRMSKRDGRSVLIGSTERRGFWSVQVPEPEREANELAGSRCPVKIIRIS